MRDRQENDNNEALHAHVSQTTVDPEQNRCLQQTFKSRLRQQVLVNGKRRGEENSTEEEKEEKKENWTPLLLSGESSRAFLFKCTTNSTSEQILASSSLGAVTLALIGAVNPDIRLSFISI